jgi:hypothetical protein
MKRQGDLARALTSSLNRHLNGYVFVFQRRGGRAIRQAGQTRAAEKQKERGVVALVL